MTSKEIYEKIKEIGQSKAFAAQGAIPMASEHDWNRATLKAMILVMEWMDEEIVGGWKDHARNRVEEAIEALFEAERGR